MFLSLLMLNASVLKISALLIKTLKRPCFNLIILIKRPANASFLILITRIKTLISNLIAVFLHFYYVYLRAFIVRVVKIKPVAPA